MGSSWYSGRYSDGYCLVIKRANIEFGGCFFCHILVSAPQIYKIGQIDGIAYFKDPGDKTCYYDATEETWYKTDVEESGELATCPLFNESNPPSQPMGPVCDDQDDDYVGQYCSEDEDCGDGRCVDTGDATGWAGTCSADTSGCTIYSDPFTGANEITNESFEQHFKTSK